MKKGKKEVPISVKGMRDIIGEEFYKYEGFMEKASEVAMYYGFQPIETPMLEKTEVFTSGVGEETDVVQKEMYELKTKGGNHLAMRPEGTAGVVRAYIENGMQAWPQPVMLYYRGPFFRHEKPQKGRHREFYQFGLECLGSPKSIMDAEVIHTMCVILKETGVENLCVRINSIGEKESRARYTHELTQYYKKFIGEICDDCQRRMKKNPLRLLDCKVAQCLPIKAAAPQSVASLIPASRDHFKQVLEYLEALNIPYEIDHTLVRGFDYYTETVFEFIELSDDDQCEGEELVEAGDAKEEKDAVDTKNTPKSKKSVPKETVAVPPTPEPLALGGGGRYDMLARTLGHKKDVPAIGASLGVDRIIMRDNYKKIDPRILKKPKVFFIQLGFEAKLKSLTIVEILRQAKVPIMQTLNKDGLGSQLALAERLKIPFTIIFGQKECLEECVIVRNMATHSQETVKIPELAKYIKGLK